MAFLLFVIVFIVNCNYGTARPRIDRVSDTSLNGLIETNDNGEKVMFKLPTTIEEGFSITIDGILETANKTFTVTLHDNNEASENCKISFDFEKETIYVTPGTQKDNNSAPYNFHPKDGEQSEFSLRLIARVAKGKEMLATGFEANNEGVSPQLNCDTQFDKIKYIIMQEGVTRIKSLLFSFE